MARAQIVLCLVVAAGLLMAMSPVIADAPARSTSSARQCSVCDTLRSLFPDLPDSLIVLKPLVHEEICRSYQPDACAFALIRTRQSRDLIGRIFEWFNVNGWILVDSCGGVFGGIATKHARTDGAVICEIVESSAAVGVSCAVTDTTRVGPNEERPK